MTEELDPAEFVRRIQQLGEQKDQEDRERVRKLEQDILEGRSERQKRREGMPARGCIAAIAFACPPAD